MTNTARERSDLRKYAQGKSVQIQGAVRNVIGSMLLLEKDPNDTDAWKRLVINDAAFKALTSEDREKSGD